MPSLQSAAGRVSQAWSFSHWPLRRKLAAALIFPVLVAFAFGGLRVKSEFDKAQEFERAADSTYVLRPLVDFNLAVQKLAAADAPGGAGRKSAEAAYDTAAESLTRAIKGTDASQSITSRANEALVLGRAVRVAATQQGALSVVMDKSANAATLISTLVGDLGLTNDVDSVKTLVAMQDTIAAQRAMTAQQLNLANTSDANGAVTALQQVGAEVTFLARVQSEVGTATSDARLLLNDNARRSLALQGVLDKDTLPPLVASYQSSNGAYSSLAHHQLSELESSLRARANEHRSQALINTALVIGSLLAALVLVLALMQSLLNPIRVVRHGALDVARRKLPEAVRRIRDGEEPPELEPIPVHTNEEMGQLARAVDNLHRQALSLAGEQARLRTQVGNMFETLSRRSTSLIDQQLTLIESLERDEEDPRRLQSLFRLDHLAARMRRNSDSLLVLAGTSTRRGISGSVAVSDVVRAAVSEVENYQRIDIGETSDDQVLASVGSDLIHLLAEIVDNALSYSPPTSRVSLRGARTSDGGLLLEVTDGGLGMSREDLEALNQGLATGGDVTADTARRMGLFVVGSLAKRHGVAVRLRANEGAQQIGITAAVHLPAALLADSEAASKPAPVVPPAPAGKGLGSPGRKDGAAGPRVNGSSHPSLPSAPLNGHARAERPAPSLNAHARPAPSAPAPSAPVASLKVESAAPSAQDDAPRPSSGLPVRKPMATGITALTGGPVVRPPAAAPAPPTPSASPTPSDALPASAVKPSTDEKPAPAPGLPVRTPNATRITDHTGGPVARPEGTPGAPEATDATPARAERRPTNLSGWLERRASASAAARARKAAEREQQAGESAGMPAALSGWLEARERVAGSPAESQQRDSASSAAPAPADPVDTEPDQGAIPETAEAAPRAPEAVETAESPETVESADTAEAPQSVESADTAEAPETHQIPESHAEVTSAMSQQDDPGGSAALPRRQPGTSGIYAAVSDQTQPAPAATPAPAPAQLAEPALAADTAPAEEGHAAPADESRAVLPVRTPGASGAVAERGPAASPQSQQARRSTTAYFGARKAQAAKPEEDLLDTPIFRSMMSRWLSDPAEGGSDEPWSPSEADEGWSAAARVESAEPQEESSAGLPLRRPGDYLVPGAIESAEREQVPAAAKRDPESIRRSLNRHHNGVSSARAEAQDGTHREEADVHN